MNCNPCVDGHLCWFWLFDIVNKETIKMGAQISLWWGVGPSGSMLRSEMAGLYGNSTFNYCKFPNGFQNDCINLYFHQQWTKTFLHPYNLKHLLLDLLKTTSSNFLKLLKWKGSGKVYRLKRYWQTYLWIMMTINFNIYINIQRNNQQLKTVVLVELKVLYL